MLNLLTNAHKFTPRGGYQGVASAEVDPILLGGQPAAFFLSQPKCSHL